MRRSSCCAIRSCAARPVVIGGGRRSAADAADARAAFATLRDYVGRGVATTATYEARALGVHSGMGLMKAARLAPDAIRLPVDFDAYRRYSRLFKAAVRDDRAADRGPRHRRDLHRSHRRRSAADVARDGAGDRPARRGTRARAVDQGRGARGDRTVVVDRRRAEQAAREDRLRARQARRHDDRPHQPTLRSGSGRCRRGKHQRHRPEGGGEARSARHPHDRRARARPTPQWLVEQLRPPLRRLDARGRARPRRAAGGHAQRAQVDQPRDHVRSRSLARRATARSCRRSSPIFASASPATSQRSGYAGRTIGLKLRFDNFRTVTRDQTIPAADAGRADDPPRRRRVPEARHARAADPPARRACRRADSNRRRRRSARAAKRIRRRRCSEGGKKNPASRAGSSVGCGS